MKEDIVYGQFTQQKVKHEKSQLSNMIIHLQEINKDFTYENISIKMRNDESFPK